MWQRRQNARGVTAWWGRYRVRPAVQVGLAFAVGVAAFGLAAVVSPHLRALDGDALFVLGIFILVALLVTEIAARAGRRADESEQARGLLADEQAALRRVATLVARGVPPEEVFAAVTEEVARLLPVGSAALGRYEPDGMFTTVAAWSTREAAFPVGGQWMPGGKNVTTIALETGRPARIDDFADASGPIGVAARAAGYRSAIGTPIVVEGRLWGVMTASSWADDALPADTEARLANFTELLATAIANAESRAGLARLAAEQAALQRVATLVARAVPPEEVFSTVTDELGRLLGADIAGLIRLDPGNTALVLAVWGAAEGDYVPVGTRIPVEDSSVPMMVGRTGRPARRDIPEQASDAASARARKLGINSTVGAPIVVEGRLWGGMSVSSKQAEPLPPNTESRIAAFAELVATAIANAEARTELAASRARVVATADETRRRLERNLHDGAQQRLVSLALQLRAAEAVASKRKDVGPELSRIGEELDEALEDLRKLSHGLHPAILSEGGLKPALKTLARRSAVPVELDVRIETRLPEGIEVAAYYVVSEGLANAVKHADASVAKVEVEAVEDSVRISIWDDGRGGADPARGSGLIGLKDRVEAQGGTISVVSPPDEGTRLQVSLPVGAPDEPPNAQILSSALEPVSARRDQVNY